MVPHRAGATVDRTELVAAHHIPVLAEVDCIGIGRGAARRRVVAEEDRIQGSPEVGVAVHSLAEGEVVRILLEEEGRHRVRRKVVGVGVARTAGSLDTTSFSMV